MRRRIIAVIGPAQSGCTSEILLFAEKLGVLLIDAGFRIVTGGYDGIMKAVFIGAKKSLKYREGDTVGIIMSLNPGDANEYADIVITTGIRNARNQIVTSTADAVVAIAGGAGTLSEVAFAWKFNKPIIAVTGLGGWSEKIAGKFIDNQQDKPVISASTVEDVIKNLITLFREKPEDK